MMDALHKAADFEDKADASWMSDKASAPSAAGDIPLAGKPGAPAPPRPAEPEEPAPQRGAGGNEKELMDALFEAADFEDKVVTPTTSRVSQTGGLPGSPADNEPTRPMGGEIGVDWSAAPERTRPPDDAEFVAPPWRPSKRAVLVSAGVVLLLLMISSFFAMSLSGSDSPVARRQAPTPPSAPGNRSVDTLPDIAPPAPKEASKYWAPAKPSELQRLAEVLPESESLPVFVQVFGPGEGGNVFGLTVTDESIDYSGIRIEDEHGQRVAARQLHELVSDALTRSLLDRLTERGFSPQAQEAFEDATLRVTFRLTPAWSVPRAAPLPEAFARHSRLPCGVDVVVSEVALVRDAETLRLVGGGGVFTLQPRTFAVSREAKVIGGAPEEGRAEQGELRVAGLVKYSGLDVLGPARDAGSWVAALIGRSERDWKAIWDPEDPESVPMGEALRAVFAAAGSAFMADVLSNHPDRIGQVQGAGLLDVLGDAGSPSEWLRPFASSKSPYGEAALRRLAERRDEFSIETFRKCLADADDYSPEAVQACAVALLDMGRVSSELLAALEGGNVEDFSGLRGTRGLPALDESDRTQVMRWMLENGSPCQRVSAALLASGEKNEELKPLVEKVLAAAPEVPGEVFADACRTLWATGKGDFETYRQIAEDYLARNCVGDVPVDFPSSAAKPPFLGVLRLSDVVCAGMVREGGDKAAPALLKLLDSPSPLTRISAIRGLLDLDYVDAAPSLRDRYVALTQAGADGKTLDPFEKAEFETLRPKIAHLSRYETKIAGLKMLLAQKSFSRAESVVKEIADQRPDSDVARRATAMLEEARAPKPNPIP
jgi:hypothetical protein